MTLDVIQSIFNKIDVKFFLEISPGIILLGYSIYSFSSSLNSSKNFSKNSFSLKGGLNENSNDANAEIHRHSSKYNLKSEDLVVFQRNLSKITSLNSLQKDICAAIGVDVLEAYGFIARNSSPQKTINEINTYQAINRYRYRDLEVEFPLTQLNSFIGSSFEDFNYANRQASVAH